MRKDAKTTKTARTAESVAADVYKDTVVAGVEDTNVHYAECVNTINPMHGVLVGAGGRRGGASGECD